MIEILDLVLLIGIMSVGINTIPRFEKRIELEELRHEKKFTYTLWGRVGSICKETI